MSEMDWLGPIDLEAYARFVKKIGTPRKIRLIVASCLRTSAAYSSRGALLLAAETMEHYADGLIPAERLTSLQSVIRSLLRKWTSMLQSGEQVDGINLERERELHTAAADSLTPNHDDVALSWMLEDSLPRLQRYSMPVKTICDVFREPFGPTGESREVLHQQWLTADVLGLARGIYQERAFDRLPILADALMDAGCDNEQILGHCRGPGPHVRGCWVVDLVLGKE